MSDTALQRFKVAQNFRGLRAGEIVEIDPNEPGWRAHVDAGRLLPVAEEPTVDFVEPPKDSRPERATSRRGRTSSDDS